MTGNETLASVRKRLAAAMAVADGTKASSSGRSDVAEALERFLAGPAGGRVKVAKSSRKTRIDIAKSAEPIAVLKVTKRTPSTRGRTTAAN